MNAERAVSAMQMAEQLGVGKDTVYRLARTGEIPAMKVGRQWRFFPSAVTAELNAPTDLWARPSRKKVHRRDDDGIGIPRCPLCL